ncbi:MAG: hypothetical protein J6V25_00805 [Oscillospiraceae bacterium]|nr:hypothetical protein [Oscillospiraceae bacterium]
MICIDSSFYILASVLLLTVPLRWIIFVVLSALIHELAHLLALRLCGGNAYSIHIGIGGARINAYLPDSRLSFLCILAGPLASLSLVFLYRELPQLSLCGLVQGFFNLLPIEPLDGGRLLRCFMNHLFPEKADSVLYAARFLIIISFLILTVLAIFPGNNPIFF